MSSRWPTARQRQVIGAIIAFLDKNGYPPTIRELGEILGIKSTNGVAEHLAALERKGLLRRDPLKSRGIQLLAWED